MANNLVNSKMIWQKIKRCTGTRQRPSQHPDPIQESNRLLSEFVARSSSDQLTEDDLITLQQQQSIRQQQLYYAINSSDECDRPIVIFKLNNVLKKVRNSSPGDDIIVYSMLKNIPRPSCINLHICIRAPVLLEDCNYCSCSQEEHLIQTHITPPCPWAGNGEDNPTKNQMVSWTP